MEAAELPAAESLHDNDVHVTCSCCRGEDCADRAMLAGSDDDQDQLGIGDVDIVGLTDEDDLSADVDEIESCDDRLGDFRTTALPTDASGLATDGEPTCVSVVGVKFRKSGKVYYFSPNQLNIAVGDPVIVETARGVEFGIVACGPKDILTSEVVSPLKPVVRKASAEDQQRAKENEVKEKEALDICISKVAKHELPMKLVDVEYTFDRNKLVFYFTADGRVDFRELVKDLAAVFRTRIELRQIGVRDEAKMIGGLGCCGRPMCCASFLGDFEPVSIKMAKEQNLSLNPAKISGVCGRLMCCLRYEYEAYKACKQGLPKVGQEVKTAKGAAKVIDVDILRRLVRLDYGDGGQHVVPAAEIITDAH
jgi:cell fate regulator YaaT (PSP1 superfamily)